MTPAQAGIRLDRLVAEVASVSRRVARLWIAQGKVQVNGKPTRILTRPVRSGARLIVTAPTEGRPGCDPASGPRSHVALEILHLDRAVVVVNKPAGLLTEPDRLGSPSLLAEVSSTLSRNEAERQVFLVHRLDAGTSGVVVLARTRQAAEHLSDSFRCGRAEKVYLALCVGEIHEPVVVDAPIDRIGRNRHGVVAGGKPAITRLEPLATMHGFAAVWARPETGRTHQIRVHLAHLGHPIVGDRLYGGPRYVGADPMVPVSRPMLHAFSLRLPHPKTDAAVEFTAALPEDFRQAAAMLGLRLPAMPHQQQDRR